MGIYESTPDTVILCLNCVGQNCGGRVLAVGGIQVSRGLAQSRIGLTFGEHFRICLRPGHVCS